MMQRKEMLERRIKSGYRTFTTARTNSNDEAQEREEEAR